MNTESNLLVADIKPFDSSQLPKPSEAELSESIHPSAYMTWGIYRLESKNYIMLNSKIVQIAH